jgi:hypothetical protein
MRTHRWISVFTLLAALTLGACGGGEDEQTSETGNDNDATVGSADGISPTVGQERSPGPGEGGQSLGSPSAQEQTTTVDDTTPHRPGAPAPP